MQRKNRFFAVVIAVITIFTAFACSTDNTIVLSSSPEPLPITPSPTPTATPSPTPSPSPTPLPMDVDLGLTDELRNQEIELCAIFFMNISIDSNEYWVVGDLRPVKGQENTEIFTNFCDKKTLVYFYDSDKLSSFTIHYKRKDMELGEYKPNSDILASIDFKVNKVLGIYDYKQEYPSNVKTSIDYLMEDDKTYVECQFSFITYAQLEEFYRATVTREKWFVPSERYVKIVENTPNETD